MKKIKTLKIKNEDGSINPESYTISPDAINIDMKNGKNLQETVGNIDIDEDGSIENQLKNLKEKKVYYFNNISNLKNAKGLKIGDYVVTKGYYKPNDGGTGEYLIRTKTQNDVNDGGSIHFVGDSLVAELIVKNEVNVKQFGAKGDNETNDTQFIQNAINYASVKNKGVVVQKGIYRVESVTLKSNTNLYGLNKDECIIKRIESFNTDNYSNYYRNGYILGNYQTDTTRIKNIRIKNITVDGVKDKLTYTNEEKQRNNNNGNIYIRQCDDVFIDNIISVNSCKSGINLSGCDNILIQNSEFAKNGINIPNTDQNGITIYGKFYNDSSSSSIKYLSKNVKIINNNSHSNTDEGIAYAYCRNIDIKDNIFIYNGDRGIEGDSSGQGAELLDINIDGNYVSNNAKNAITEYSKPTGNINYICVNNIIKNVGKIALGIGLSTTGTSNITISNNIIDNCEGSAFNIVGTNVIVNKNIVKNSKGDLSVSGVESVSFNENIFFNDIPDSNIVDSKTCYIKSNKNMRICDNDITNFLNRITIQKYNSDVTAIENLISSRNIVNNLTYLLSIQTNIDKFIIESNCCIDNREIALFASLFAIGANYSIGTCNMNNNTTTQAKYKIDLTNITKITRNSNTFDKCVNFRHAREYSNSQLNLCEKRRYYIFIHTYQWFPCGMGFWWKWMERFWNNTITVKKEVNNDNK